MQELFISCFCKFLCSSDYVINLKSFKTKNNVYWPAVAVEVEVAGGPCMSKKLNEAGVGEALRERARLVFGAVLAYFVFANAVPLIILVKSVTKAFNFGSVVLFEKRSWNQPTTSS
jgi:hypothetical protein